MKKCLCVLSILIVLAVVPPGLQASGININDTKLLSQPAVSQTHIAFAYAGDLWVANIDGKGVRRLTSAQGTESDPVFSPDGKLIAFNGEYDGNMDVYVVPVEGGVPKRLTWHPGPDLVRGWTNDGRRVVFASGAVGPSPGATVLYLVRVWLTAVAFAMPFIALMGLTGALTAHPFLALLVGLMYQLVIWLFSSIGGWAIEDLKVLAYGFPSGIKYQLASQNPEQVLIAAAHSLGMGLLFYLLGLWIFTKRDL